MSDDTDSPPSAVSTPYRVDTAPLLMESLPASAPAAPPPRHVDMALAGPPRLNWIAIMESVSRTRTIDYRGTTSSWSPSPSQYVQSVPGFISWSLRNAMPTANTPPARITLSAASALPSAESAPMAEATPPPPQVSVPAKAPAAGQNDILSSDGEHPPPLPLMSAKARAEKHRRNFFPGNTVYDEHRRECRGFNDLNLDFPMPRSRAIGISGGRKRQQQQQRAPPHPPTENNSERTDGSDCTQWE